MIYLLVLFLWQTIALLTLIKPWSEEEVPYPDMSMKEYNKQFAFR